MFVPIIPKKWQKLLSSLMDENLREKMIKAGKERVEGFDWEEGAREVLDSFKKL